MAAVDTFRAFNQALDQTERKKFEDLRRVTSEELLAARSEEARVRIVETYIREIHHRNSSSRETRKVKE